MTVLDEWTGGGSHEILQDTMGQHSIIKHAHSETHIPLFAHGFPVHAPRG